MKIAFSGKARSGKDTSCDYIIKQLNNNLEPTTKLTFATPLYDCLYSCQNILELNKGKDRNFLQTIGDWARDINSNIFVNIAENKINNTNGNIIISDLRFPNEYHMLKKNNFILIRISRNNSINNNNPTNVDILNQKQKKHRSEILLDDFNFDYYIDNNGTIEELYEKLNNILNNILNNQ